MKKILCLVAILLLTLSLTACGGASTTSEGGTTQEQVKTLDDYDIGDELPIYPTVTFDYTYVDRQYPQTGGVIETPYAFHITSAKATLVKKNTISEGGKISGDFYPFVVKLTVIGTAQETLAGRAMSVWYRGGFNSPIASGTVEFDGSFTCEQEFNVVALETLYFNKITLD